MVGRTSGSRCGSCPTPSLRALVEQTERRGRRGAGAGRRGR
nr:hypothetical protein [Angustibacter aerolatus]